MSDEIYPRHYESWKRCITKKCRIDLTRDYIEQRITALSSPDSSDRKAFEEKFGTNWTEAVLGYFKRGP